MLVGRLVVSLGGLAQNFVCWVVLGHAAEGGGEDGRVTDGVFVRFGRRVGEGWLYAQRG